MNPTDRLNLEKMIRENDIKDSTEEIRQKKHSDLINNDVKKILFLKSKYNRLMLTNNSQFESIVRSQCTFLHNNYSDIFYKVLRDEINLNTLGKLLDILKKIELGENNQHDGSYEVGKLLKQLYIDSVILKEQKLKKSEEKKKKKTKHKESKIKNMSWSEYKLKNDIVL